MNQNIILAGTRYNIQLIDNQAIFTTYEGGIRMQFSLERPPIKDKPGIWQLYSLNAEDNAIPICHIEHALSFVKSTFGKDFAPYKGGISYLMKPQPDKVEQKPKAFGADGCGDLY